MAGSSSVLSITNASSSCSQTESQPVNPIRKRALIFRHQKTNCKKKHVGETQNSLEQNSERSFFDEKESTFKMDDVKENLRKAGETLLKWNLGGVQPGRLEVLEMDETLLKMKEFLQLKKVKAETSKSVRQQRSVSLIAPLLDSATYLTTVMEKYVQNFKEELRFEDEHNLSFADMFFDDCEEEVKGTDAMFDVCEDIEKGTESGKSVEDLPAKSILKTSQRDSVVEKRNITFATKATKVYQDNETSQVSIPLSSPSVKSLSGHNDATIGDPSLAKNKIGHDSLANINPLESNSEQKDSTHLQLDKTPLEDSNESIIESSFPTLSFSFNDSNTPKKLEPICSNNMKSKWIQRTPENEVRHFDGFLKLPKPPLVQQKPCFRFDSDTEQGNHFKNPKQPKKSGLPQISGCGFNLKMNQSLGKPLFNAHKIYPPTRKVEIDFLTEIMKLESKLLSKCTPQPSFDEVQRTGNKEFESSFLQSSASVVDIGHSSSKQLESKALATCNETQNKQNLAVSAEDYLESSYAPLSREKFLSENLAQGSTSSMFRKPEGIMKTDFGVVDTQTSTANSETMRSQSLFKQSCHLQATESSEGKVDVGYSTEKPKLPSKLQTKRWPPPFSSAKLVGKHENSAIKSCLFNVLLDCKKSESNTSTPSDVNKSEQNMGKPAQNVDCTLGSSAAVLIKEKQHFCHMNLNEIAKPDPGIASSPKNEKDADINHVSSFRNTGLPFHNFKLTIPESNSSSEEDNTEIQCGTQGTLSIAGNNQQQPSELFKKNDIKEKSKFGISKSNASQSINLKDSLTVIKTPNSSPLHSILASHNSSISGFEHLFEEKSDLSWAPNSFTIRDSSFMPKKNVSPISYQKSPKGYATKAITENLHKPGSPDSKTHDNFCGGLNRSEGNALTNSSTVSKRAEKEKEVNCNTSPKTKSGEPLKSRENEILMQNEIVTSIKLVKSTNSVHSSSTSPLDPSLSLTGIKELANKPILTPLVSEKSKSDSVGCDFSKNATKAQSPKNIMNEQWKTIGRPENNAPNVSANYFQKSLEEIPVQDLDAPKDLTIYQINVEPKKLDSRSIFAAIFPTYSPLSDTAILTQSCSKTNSDSPKNREESTVSRPSPRRSPNAENPQKYDLPKGSGNVTKNLEQAESVPEDPQNQHEKSWLLNNSTQFSKQWSGCFNSNKNNALQAHGSINEKPFSGNITLPGNKVACNPTPFPVDSLQITKRWGSVPNRNKKEFTIPELPPNDQFVSWKNRAENDLKNKEENAQHVPTLFCHKKMRHLNTFKSLEQCAASNNEPMAQNSTARNIFPDEEKNSDLGAELGKNSGLGKNRTHIDDGTDNFGSKLNPIKSETSNNLDLDASSVGTTQDLINKCLERGSNSKLTYIECKNLSWGFDSCSISQFANSFSECEVNTSPIPLPSKEGEDLMDDKCRNIASFSHNDQKPVFPKASLITQALKFNEGMRSGSPTRYNDKWKLPTLGTSAREIRYSSYQSTSSLGNNSGNNGAVALHRSEVNKPIKNVSEALPNSPSETITIGLKPTFKVPQSVPNHSINLRDEPTFSQFAREILMNSTERCEASLTSEPYAPVTTASAELPPTLVISKNEKAALDEYQEIERILNNVESLRIPPDSELIVAKNIDELFNDETFPW